MTRRSLKHVGFALAISCSGASAYTADPAIPLGVVTPDVPLPFSELVIPAGDFSDLFAFTLPANSGSGYSVMNFPISIPGVGTFNSLLNTMVLLSNPDGGLVPNGDETVLKTVAGAGVNSLSMSWGSASDGSMLLQITGIANGTLGGVYNGGISVASIPEAEVWVMMLVGAGLVGFQLRRKAKCMAVQRLV
jgi:hypothetical protein